MIKNHVLILKQSSVNDSLKNLKCKSKTRTTVFNSDMARTRHILTRYVHLRNGNGEVSTVFVFCNHVPMRAASFACAAKALQFSTRIVLSLRPGLSRSVHRHCLAWWHVQRQVRMLWVQNQGCSDITQRSIGECCRRCPRVIHFRHYVFWKPLLLLSFSWPTSNTQFERQRSLKQLLHEEGYEEGGPR